MQAILVVNAGSSSVKFQVFQLDGSAGLTRLLKGQMDGIGTQPKLVAQDAQGHPLIDRMYPVERVADVPSAMQEAGAWLRETQKIDLVAVGHRVVHGGPEYSEPVRVDAEVLDKLARYMPLAPLHQPNNLAPIRTLLER